MRRAVVSIPSRGYWNVGNIVMSLFFEIFFLDVNFELDYFFKNNEQTSWV